MRSFLRSHQKVSILTTDSDPLRQRDVFMRVLAQILTTLPRGVLCGGGGVIENLVKFCEAHRSEKKWLRGSV